MLFQLHTLDLPHTLATTGGVPPATLESKVSVVVREASICEMQHAALMLHTGERNLLSRTKKAGQPSGWPRMRCDYDSLEVDAQRQLCKSWIVGAE